MDETLNHTNQPSLPSPCLLDQNETDSRSGSIYDNRQMEEYMTVVSRYSSNYSNDSYTPLSTIKKDETMPQGNKPSQNSINKQKLAEPTNIEYDCVDITANNEYYDTCVDITANTEYNDIPANNFNLTHDSNLVST